MYSMIATINIRTILRLLIDTSFFYFFDFNMGIN